MNTEECPEPVRFWFMDDCAECLPGISKDTYADLWRVLCEAGAEMARMEQQKSL